MLSSPTRSRRDKGAHPATVEEATWPERATILALVSLGFTYAEARDLSPLQSRAYMGISAAWSIPPEDRVGGSTWGTADQARSILGK